MALRLPRVQFIGRTWREYEQIWNLRLDDLIGKDVLDCPCGPASFVSEGRRRGINIVGCDPVFALSPAQLRAHGEQDTAESLRQIARQSPGLAGSDPQAYAQNKYAAIEALASDFERHGPSGPECDGRYVNASLPSLPFADRSFDLVLSAHLLFVYAPSEDQGFLDSRDFDLPFHLRAVTELARVSRHEIRLYPTYGIDPDRPMRHPYAEPIMSHLRALGMRARYEPSTYDQGVAEWNHSLVAEW